MKKLFGFIIMILSIFLGLYIGFYLCLYGGILDIFHGFMDITKSPELIAWGIIKIICASLFGWGSWALGWLIGLSLLR